MTKIKAFGVHVMFTMVLMAVLVTVMLSTWYVNPFGQLTNRYLVLSLVCLSLLIFPCLTALVYQPNKKSLVTDIMVIMLLQLSVLLSGVYILAQLRPAWLVLMRTKLHMVRPIDIRNIEGNNYHMPIGQQPWYGPRYMTLKKSITNTDKTLLNDAIFYGSAALYPQLLEPLEMSKLYQYRWSLDDIYDQKLKETLKHQYPMVGYYIPIVGSHGKEIAMVLFTDSNDLIDVYVPDFLSNENK